MKAHIIDKDRERLLLGNILRVLADKHIEYDNINRKLEPGEKVKLNYEKIIGHKGYRNLNPLYKKFVEANKDTVFTVTYDQKHAKNKILACFEEDTSDPRWLFWVYDLKRVDNGGKETDVC